MNESINDNAIYDYYYSPTQADISDSLDIPLQRKTKCFINGKRYTEMIKKGGIPHCAKFKDYVKIHTGTQKGLKVVFL